MEAKKALSKCMQYCSKAEYCIFDIEQKLTKWEIPTHEHQKIITRLIEEKFLDEERYVNAYVKDKFQFNRWGKTKISYMLKQKGIIGELLNNALESIDQEDYLALIEEELLKKAKSLKAKDDYDMKVKLLRFLSSRGFESELIYKMYERHINKC